MNGEESSGKALTPLGSEGLAIAIDLNQAPDRAASVFGQRLTLDRRAAGLTRNDLSDRTGISVPYVARIEGGRANPTLDTMVKLADAVGGDLANMLRPAPDTASHR